LGALKVGHPVALTLPFRLSIADLRISWTRTVRESDGVLAAARRLHVLSGPRLRSAALLSVGIVTVAAIVSNLVAVGSGSARGFVDMSLRVAPATTQSGGSARSDMAKRLSAPPANAVDQAAEELKREVERAGLLNVTIDASGGVVMARGSVEPGVAAQWQSIQQWFDERFKGEVMLVNGVVLKAEKLPSSLAIEGVWRGPQSHLVIRGQKYLEGAMLDNGWTIQRIEVERVVLSRDGRLVAVRY
jgi:type III secretion protein D